MPDLDPILAGLNAGELRELRTHAMRSVDAGPGADCSLEAAAVSLLSAHLRLMRDCKGVLPPVSQPAPGGKPVSLGGGIKGPAHRHHPRTPFEAPATYEKD